jgi:glycosyltransferase involved in cell wall biosynthesis
MEKSPLVSVIVPCYNNEVFVGEAIKSALRQEYRPKEIIVVDDGSSDGSVQNIKSFGERVRWKRTPNRGAAAARNEGLRMANGELVKFLDADDLLADGVLRRQVYQIQEKCKGNQIPFGEYGSINKKGNRKKKKNYHRFDDEKEISILDILKEIIQTSAPLHRQSRLLEVGGFDEDMWKQNEYDLHIRLHAAGVRFRYFKGMCCYCRVHESEERLSNRDAVAEDPRSVRTWIRKRIKLLQHKLGTPLPEEVQVHFAQSLWAAGRRAIRAGHLDVARQYFDDARQLHSEKCVNGSFLYRAGVRLLGPRHCESVKNLLETDWF